jgi:hypothetical protein
LMQFVGLGDFHISQSQSLKLGGQSAHEIIGESLDKPTNTQLMTVQWLRFGTPGIIQMFGMARKDAWDAVLPRMRAIRDGFLSQ